MNINELTLGQIKEIQSLTNNNTATTDGLNQHIGQKVIIRTYSAGVWFGKLDKKSGKEVILTEARRMYRWWAKKSISLSGCALYGIQHSNSKICAPVDSIWLEAIEIIECTDVAIKSISEAEEVEAE